MATVMNTPEQRVVLENISWEMYESLLAAHRDRSVPRFTYDQGWLEIMSPSAAHEELNRAVARLVEVITEEMDIDIRNLGSTTFRRGDLDRGFEPDSCFYIQSIDRIKGKTELDLKVDPPPDLVIEIDLTSPSIKKLPIFAQLGVPEVWRYDGSRWSILVLESAEYVEREESRALPGATSAIVSRFLEESRHMRRPDWLKRVREWARSAQPES